MNPECLKKDNVDIVPQIGSVGNIAAMLEALEFVAHLDDDSYTSYDIEVAVQKAKSALSKPQRNCDRFNSEREMQFAFLAELISMGRSGASLEEYSKWLLAEAKGEGDGK